MSFDGVSGTLTVAAVQATPVFLDRTATVEVAARHVAEADAELVVFPESFVPGYPDWVWRRPPMSDGDWYARLVADAVRVDGTDLDPLRDAARDAGAWVALGVTERSRSDTLYNTVVYLGATGEIAGRHRKLVPTGAERLVWANGNDHLLTVVDIGGVRVGSLICWENYMPLARMAMYEHGVDVLLAPTWTTVTSGCPRCATSPRRARSSSSVSPPSSAGAMCRGISRMLMSCTAARTTSCRVATPRSSLLAEG